MDAESMGFKREVLENYLREIPLSYIECDQLKAPEVR